MDTKNGLNWYDYGARQYDAAIGRFTTVDALSEKRNSISPYCYCQNNPITRIDPSGMLDHWFRKKDGNILFDSGVVTEADLNNGEEFLGADYTENNGTSYRSDGSILFKDETKAYNRMWRQASVKQIEEGGYALKNGHFLVLPDYANKSDVINSKEYGYSVGENGTLSNKSGETLDIIGNVYTHQDVTKDATPSFVGSSNGDIGHSEAMGGLPIITIGHDGKVHGAFWNQKGNGYSKIDGLGSRASLLSGKTKLIPWLQTYPTK